MASTQEFSSTMEDHDEKKELKRSSSRKSSSTREKSAGHSTTNSTKKTDAMTAATPVSEGASVSTVTAGEVETLSQDVKNELGTLISQQLAAYFGEFEEVEDFPLTPGQGAGHDVDELVLDDIDVDKDIDRVMSGAEHLNKDSEESSNNLVDEYLSELNVVPRRGAEVPENVSNIINNAFRSKLSDEVRASKLKLFEIPGNCPGLERVKVNQTVWDKVSPQTRSMDIKLQQIQSQVVAAGAGVSKVLTEIMAMEPEKLTKPTIAQLTKDLLNIEVLVGQSNVDLNHRRRELIKTDLNVQYHHLCATTVPFTNWLFGDDLNSQVRDIADANKVCGKIFPQNQRGRGLRRGRSMRFRPYGIGRAYGRGRGYGYGGRPGYGQRPARDGGHPAAAGKKPVKTESGEVREVCESVGPVGGRLSKFVENWKGITSDKAILSDVMGISLEFEEEPSTVASYPVIVRSETEMAVLHTEIQQLMNKGVLELADWDDSQVLSSIFLLPKPDGSFRTIFNMSRLNTVIKYRHFKMDTLETAQSLLRPHWWMATVDLKDAYFTVPVLKQFRKYLRFAIGNEVYQFKAMPMGLSSAPRIFTKILKPILAKLRQNGIICMAYIDDLLFLSPTAQECKQAVENGIKLLRSVGFVINEKKSQFEPTQKLRYLGFMLDSAKMLVTLPEEKVLKVTSACQRLLANPKLSIQELAEFIGMILSYSKASNFGVIHYRALERLKILALKQNRGSFEGQVTLTNECLNDVQWWLENAGSMFKNVSHGSPTITLCTDASQEGWGAVNETSKESTGGLWSPEEMPWHINVKEIQAIFLGLQSLCKDTNCHVLVKSDNVTAVAYVRNMGGVRSILCDKVAVELWDWCIERQIWLSVTYIPGKDNVVADYESRTQSGDTEWSLNVEVYQTIIDKWGTPDIDLFASRLNNKVDKYVSWKPDPFAMHIDAFTLSWNGPLMYIFAPFSLIGRILQKIEEDGCEAIVIVPVWPTAAWYSLLPSLLIDFPLLLPQMYRLLTRGDILHPLRNQLRLVACRLSGDRSKVDVFHRELRNSSWGHGDRALRDNIDVTCAPGAGFVLTTMLIPFHRI